METVEELINLAKSVRNQLYNSIVTGSLCRECKYSTNVCKAELAIDSDLKDIERALDMDYETIIKRLKPHAEASQLVQEGSLVYLETNRIVPEGILCLIEDHLYEDNELEVFVPGKEHIYDFVYVMDRRSGKIYRIFSSHADSLTISDVRHLLEKAKWTERLAGPKEKLPRGKRRKICNVLIANNVSNAVRKWLKTVDNLVIIDLGIIDRSTKLSRGMRIYGPEHLITEDFVILKIKDFVKSLYKSYKPERNRREFSSYWLQDVKELIASLESRIVTCAHISTGLRHASFWPGHEVRVLDEVEHRASDIYSKYKELIKLASKGDIVPFVKKKLDGSLDAEHLYLFCKDCGKKLLEMGSLILIPREEPCAGGMCIIRHFIINLAEKLGCSYHTVAAYNFYVLKTTSLGNIVIAYPGSSLENVEYYDPQLILYLYPRYPWTSPRRTLAWVFSPLAHHHVPWREYNILSPLEGHHYIAFPAKSTMWDKKTIEKNVSEAAAQIAALYAIPCLLYVLDLDIYSYSPVAHVDNQDLINSIINVDFALPESFKGWKEPHNALQEKLRELGYKLGFIAEVERPQFGRVDVVWLNKQGHVEVAFEIEFSRNIEKALWKLCEISPKLAVLVVKASHYGSAFNKIIASNILKRLGQRLLLIELSNRSHVLIEGNKILALKGPRPLDTW